MRDRLIEIRKEMLDTTISQIQIQKLEQLESKIVLNLHCKIDIINHTIRQLEKEKEDLIGFLFRKKNNL